MYDRVETTLFSAIAILLAAMTVGGVSDLAFFDARAVSVDRAVLLARNASCTATAAAAPTATATAGAADRRG